MASPAISSVIERSGQSAADKISDPYRWMESDAKRLDRWFELPLSKAGKILSSLPLHDEIASLWQEVSELAPAVSEPVFKRKKACFRRRLPIIRMIGFFKTHLCERPGHRRSCDVGSPEHQADKANVMALSHPHLVQRPKGTSPSGQRQSPSLPRRTARYSLISLNLICNTAQYEILAVSLC